MKVSLENLVVIKRLVKHDATPDSILKLLAAADRNLVDAKATNISVENRFDAAYKAIPTVIGASRRPRSRAGSRSNGYR